MIPRFKSVEDEAAFWDSHSPLEFPEEFEEVTVKAERPLGHVLGVRLEAKAIDKLTAIGHKKGIGPSTLVRIWIMERISEIDEPGPDIIVRPDDPDSLANKSDSC
jgi:hypothetical protein